jgi:hypothetical protein
MDPQTLVGNVTDHHGPPTLQNLGQSIIMQRPSTHGILLHSICIHGVTYLETSSGFLKITQHETASGFFKTAFDKTNILFLLFVMFPWCKAIMKLRADSSKQLIHTSY